jgi:cobalamin biosynthesis protein CobD/CbiB
MMRISFSGLFKFLTGILLVQTATAILVLVALRTESHEVWVLLALLALTLCLLTAFWFASITTHAKKDATAQLREGFSREREKIRVRAEREKSKVMEKSHQQIIKDRSRTQAKADTKSAVLFTGVLALGGIMVFTQFFTFGLLLMTTAGGALGGYLLRSRQVLLGRKQKPSLTSAKTEKQIEDKVSGGW